MTTGNSSKTHCVIYRDIFGGWRWECADDGGHVRDSREAYDRREDCVAAARAAGVYEDEELPAGTAVPHLASALAGRSVLCASPNAPFERFLRQTLDGPALVFVSSGREALKCLNNAAYDAFILDYWLPDWTGVSFCREIRKSDPHVPICFYSNARSDDARKRALRAGGDLFLSAPVEPQLLRNRLETLVLSRESNMARAEAEENRAIQNELTRRAAQARELALHARESAARAIERTTRIKAMTAFVEAGGTRAGFDRKWPAAYSAISEWHADAGRKLP